MNRPQAAPAGGVQRGDAPNSNEDAHRSAHKAKQQTFAENLADEPPALRAQRCPNCQLLPAARHPGHQQARHIDAGQQQQQKENKGTW